MDRLLKEHLQDGQPIADWLVWTRGGKGSDHAYLARQQRIVLRNCGNIDPESIDEYVRVGGYLALQKVLDAKNPDTLINAIVESGLRGPRRRRVPDRDEVALHAPGARDDRSTSSATPTRATRARSWTASVLESDPHSVIEGMIIAGYAIGAEHGYIYVRAEYPMAIERLNIAIAQAHERGFLGDEHPRAARTPSTSSSRKAPARSSAARRPR